MKLGEKTTFSIFFLGQNLNDSVLNCLAAKSNDELWESVWDSLYNLIAESTSEVAESITLSNIDFLIEKIKTSREINSKKIIF